MFELQWPWLLALLPLPLFIMLLPAQKKEDAALRVPFFAQVKTLETQTHSLRSKKLASTFLLWLIWASLVLAAANPQWIGEPISMPNSGRDLLLAVDISESMLIPDMRLQNRKVDRLTAVKYVVGEFVQERKSDRLGLVLFGSQAYLQAPLTYDVNTVNQLLQESEIYFAGTMTSIGDAIGLSIKRLRARPEAQRVLILLTDGQNTAGELTPLQASELAEKEHVKIYTIGFGSDMTDIQGQRLTPIDESVMEEISRKTNGKYFRARNIEELHKIHEELNQLEPVESEEEKFRPIKSLFYIPLAAALLLSLCWAFASVIRHTLNKGINQSTNEPVNKQQGVAP